MGRPEGSDPVPDTLNWDVWIGPAPARPFKKDVYHPFNWRGWLDFGTGAIGDMACHTVNMSFRSLHLVDPTEIEAQAIGGMNPESYPIGSKIRFQFPARKIEAAAEPKGLFSFLHRRDTVELAPVTLWWYDGGQPLADNPSKHDGSNKPPGELLAAIAEMLGEMPGSGSLLIGDHGTVFSPDDYGEQFFVKLNDDKKFTHFKKHPAVEKIPQVIPRNQFTGDNDQRHHLEWIAAIKENKPELCYSRFAIAAPFTETTLLGDVALRVGKKIAWDSPAMRVTNAPEAARLIQHEYRAGWKLA
jgi:hypothetical protein